MTATAIDWSGHDNGGGAATTTVAAPPPLSSPWPHADAVAFIAPADDMKRAEVVTVADEIQWMAAAPPSAAVSSAADIGKRTVTPSKTAASSDNRIVRGMAPPSVVSAMRRPDCVCGQSPKAGAHDAGIETGSLHALPRLVGALHDTDEERSWPTSHGKRS
ncbi:hypothetical protein [Bifidobacterium criceti]|uniref:hypothetical protein n=1 Tax=Bifidobacterium criceti TaxID=1960969 RepID=UPI001054EDAF|nr:hypothetical protein [Bifidobacterium criceti]